MTKKEMEALIDTLSDKLTEITKELDTVKQQLQKEEELHKWHPTVDGAIEVARHNENVFNDLVHWAVEYDNETEFGKLTFWKKIQRYFANIWWAIIAPDLIPPRNIKIHLYSKLIELNKKVKSV